LTGPARPVGNVYRDHHQNKRLGAPRLQQRLGEARRERGRVPQFALVDNKRAPPHSGIGRARLLVASPVAGDLAPLVVAIGLGNTGAAAGSCDRARSEPCTKIASFRLA
jgi:hypothetical protein